MGNCLPNNNTATKPKVKLNIKWTGVYDIDELFRAAAAPLQTLDEINKALKKKTKHFKKSTFSHVIVDWTLTDSLFAMLYIFEANQEKIIENLEFKVVPDPPYLKINKHKLPHDVVKVYDDFEDLVQVLNDIPDQISELKPEIQNLAQESVEFPDKAKDICKNNNMGPTEIVKTSKRVGKNVQKISKGKTLIDEISETVKAMSECIQSFCRDHQLHLQGVEQLGSKARSENNLQPKQIISKYWPDPSRVNMKLDAPPKPKTQKN